MLLPSWEFTSCLSWPSPQPLGNVHISMVWATGQCRDVSHKNTAPQSHNRNLGAVQHVVTPAAAWHMSSWATKPVPEKRHENSQIFQPWVGPGGQRTKSCCWNTSQTEVDLLHKTCKLEVTPKLKAQLGTLTGSNCLGEWRNPESRGTARDSISRAPGQCDFTHKLCR